MTSIQIEIKKKAGKPRKQQNRLVQMQAAKKNIRIYNQNLEHGHKNENGISINASTLINNNNYIRTINKLQEELNTFKRKSKKLEDEIVQLKLKLREITEKNEKIKKNKEEEEKNSEYQQNYSSQKIIQLKKIISSTYYVLVEIIELILNQKYKHNELNIKQMENISIDLYEQSVYTEEEKKSLMLEQIQQILIFKMNFINKIYNLNLEKLCEKIKQWNFNTNKEKDASFSSFSAFSNNNNNKKRSSNFSINNSDLVLGIISPPRSPKFPGRHDSNSVISNIMDESTIKDFSTSIIHYNNNNIQPGIIGVDSFFFEGDNLLKSKEDIDNKEQSKIKDVNLINTSFKDLSIIKSGDEPGLENISFTKNLDKYVSNIGEADAEINTGEDKDKDKNKEIFIKNDNQLNISFNDI